MTWVAHKAGQIIAERYQLLEEIGSGAMGVVWRARHIVDSGMVALKVLHADADDVEHARERFLREARTLHSLRSPHIVQVLDSGIDSGIPFIVMELLAGETLRDRLKRVTRLPPSDVREVVTQVAQAIGAAHEVGIVHRDLKPENVFLVRSDGSLTTRLLDFGVAKALGGGAPLRTLTRTGMAIGTPHYMSPEQFGGIETDARSDLWSLSVIAFECLVGVRPFGGNSIAKLCLAICEEPLPIPSALCPVPPGFDAWFARGVARDRDERFQSARALTDGLVRVLGAVVPDAPTRPTAIHPGGWGDANVLAVTCIEADDEPRLMQRAGEDYRVIRERITDLVDDVMRAGGAMMSERGRAYVFTSGATAIETAVTLQQRIAAERWPHGYLVALRVAVGEARAANTDAVVDDGGLSRARALCGLGHGGQILVAQGIASRVHALSGDARLTDLGEYEVEEDIRQRVFQVVAPGTHAQFAPLRTLRGPPNNLPTELSEFVGRTQEMRAIAASIGEHRFVTLRGPGGVGKSRLAVRVAAQRSAAARDGTFLVPLAAVRDPALVLPTIASVLGVAEEGGRSTSEALADFLRPREILLVLDNFEHVTNAAADVGRLLAVGPGLRVLVTSRAALGIDGEMVYDVAPFELTAADAPLDVIAANDAIRLLLDRARRGNPGIALHADNAQTFASIVRQVDGLPLAIELAAARMDVLSPSEVSRQLTGHQTSLQDASGEVARRHRTLGDVVAWSYELLRAEERTLFRRLAVFVGGFTNALAEAVVAEPPVLALEDAISALVGNSLLRPEPQGPLARFTMFESIREFALAELEKTDEAGRIRQRHAHAICDLVTTAGPALRREGAVETRDRLALEDGNMRAALDLCVRSRDGELGLRIASSVWRYWQSAGRLHEGRRWLVELLACPDITLATRARGLDALGGLAYWQADYAMAESRYREALEIFRNLGDKLAVGETLFALSTCATWSGHSALGEELAGEALAIFEEIGAHEQVGMVRMAQGFARWMQHDLRAARQLWQTSITIAREMGDGVEAAHKTLGLAAMTYAEGRPEAAIQQAIDAMEELFARHNVALTVMAIDFIAAMVVAEQPRIAARLSGAATQLRGSMGGGMRPEACGLPHVPQVATECIGSQDFRQEFDLGRKLDLFKAIEVVRTLRSQEAHVC